MARPIKEGLEYFPLDVDMDQDDKIALIEAQHGLEGFGIVVKLLMKIYKHNYYYKWTEKEQLLFSKRVNVDINRVNVCINDCIKWELFDRKMYETFEILTSRGIQKRYLEAIGRRQEVKIIGDYLLLDNNDINAYRNLVNVDINTHSKVVNVDINTQSKVKESKVKEIESKVNNNVSNGDSLSNLSHFLEKCNFIISPMLIEKLISDIEIYSEQEVNKAIEIADGNNKRTYSYVKGILERRRAGDTGKAENIDKVDKMIKEWIKSD